MSSGARQTHRATPQPRHGSLGLVSPASFNRGLWARLLMWTMTSFALVSMIPEVSTNFRNNAEVQRHTLSPRAAGAPSLRRDTAPAAARTTALPAKVSPRSPEELIALLKRLPNSVSREESTSDVSVRFYQALRWDLDQIRDVITPRIMQYPTDQALIDRLVEFDDASRNLKHAIIVHKEVLTHSGEVANRWTDERTRASDRPLLGRFLGRRGPLGSAQPAGSQTNRT